MQPFLLEYINNTLTCHIYPRQKFPNGLYLTYDTCPETYDNQTAKLIRYCCLSIMFSLIQDSLYKKTQDWLRYNSSTILVVPAVLFNILSLAVLRRFQKSRATAKTSTTFYMKCLCIFDTLTIVSKFLYEIIVVRNGLRKHPFVINSFMCKFLSFSESCCAISSIYLLIAMSIDKLICVLAPLKVGQILTRSKARIISSCILIISAIISSYNLFDKRVFQFETSEETPQNTSNSTNLPKKRISYDCDSNWPHKKNDWILINNIIRVFLPILLLCVCNSWIAIALAKARRNTEALFGDNSRRISENNKARVFKFKTTNLKRKSVESYSTESENEDTQHRNSRANNVIHIRNRNSTQHISIMLFAVSFGFVVFNLPFALRTLFHRTFSEKFKLLDYLYHDDNLFRTKTSKTEISIAIKYEFFSSLTHFLLDLNYITNFFLYFFSGGRFRSQLYSMFKCESSSDGNITFTNSHYLSNRLESNLVKTEKKTYNPFVYLRWKFWDKNVKNSNKSNTFSYNNMLINKRGPSTVFTNVVKSNTNLNDSVRQLNNLNVKKESINDSKL